MTALKTGDQTGLDAGAPPRIFSGCNMLCMFVVPHQATTNKLVQQLDSALMGSVVCAAEAVFVCS